MRRRQLLHVNLLTEHEWQVAFQKAGFGEVKSFPYLSGKDCYLWDMLDFPMCIGLGRYKISAVLRLIGRMIPDSSRKRMYQKVANMLLRHLDKPDNDTFCATVIVAQK